MSPTITSHQLTYGFSIHTSEKSKCPKVSKGVSAPLLTRDQGASTSKLGRMFTSSVAGLSEQARNANCSCQKGPHLCKEDRGRQMPDSKPDSVRKVFKMN